MTKQKRQNSIDSDLLRGRDFSTRSAWDDAYASFSVADAVAPLGVDDLKLLAMAAYLTGREDEFLDAYERAYLAYCDAGMDRPAAHCAFWLGLTLMFKGETGRATGWLSRCRRLVEDQEHDCVERGYLLVPLVEQHLAAKSTDLALSAAKEAAETGERFGDEDLVVMARHQQGRVLIQSGRVDEGLALLDDAMIGVTRGDLSPIVTGLVYCSVIDACQEVYAYGRSREWTAALTDWCEAQPQMVTFTGRCLVHRAEIMQLGGKWQDAIVEAGLACERFTGSTAKQASASALYQQAEVYRLQGKFSAADEAYRNASQWGWEPQPGLALLRLAQERHDLAVAAIRRSVGESGNPLHRAGLLPAGVEIMLEAGDIESAKNYSQELDGIAGKFASEAIVAMAAKARGSVALAKGHAEIAFGSLREAARIWQKIEAPYLAARVRVLLGQACRMVGDTEGGTLELDAARSVFAKLGAAPDLARVDALLRLKDSGPPNVLTRRQSQVLLLIAAGKTNKAIAAELRLSEKTVDRHVSNIFDRLDVPTRAAATAYAYANNMVKA